MIGAIMSASPGNGIPVFLRRTVTQAFNPQLGFAFLADLPTLDLDPPKRASRSPKASAAKTPKTVPATQAPLMDAEAMARALKIEGPISPFTVFALTSTNPDWQALKPSAPPAAFSNNHLGYALTWFGLAVALIAFYAVLLRRRLTRKDMDS